jgi:hypothetical protein
MSPNSDAVHADTLACLLAFPDGLNALQAVLHDRQAILARDAARAAEAACADASMQPKAMETIGRRRETERWIELLAQLRRL